MPEWPYGEIQVLENKHMSFLVKISIDTKEFLAAPDFGRE